MTEKRVPVEIEPSGFNMTGFRIDELLSENFLKKLKTELPTAVIGHLAITFTDSSDIISISHPRPERKIDLSRVEVDATVPKLSNRIIEILKDVLR